MKCLHPLDIRNPVTNHYMSVSCGKCPACLHNRQKDWAYRLMMEDKYSDNPSYFVTFTFDDTLVPDASLPIELNKKFIYSFMKRFLTNLQYHKVISKPRYFLCGEYGAFGRAHYHCVFFDIPLSIDDFRILLESNWHYGFVDISSVSDSTMMYVAKYTCKGFFERDFPDKVQKPFAKISRSKDPGKWLGYRFLDDTDVISRIKKEQLFFVRSSNGSSFNLPRKYKERIFTRYERELHSDFVNSLHPVYSSFDSAIRQIHKQMIYDEQFETNFWRKLSEQRKIKLGVQP